MAEQKTAIEAAKAIASAVSAAQVTTPNPDAGKLPPVKFDRLGVERRVLGCVTDLVDFSPLGPRNTLAALTYALMNDPGTTNPPDTHGRLEVEGKTVAEIAQDVENILGKLVEAGLLSVDDGVYKVTKAGTTELGS